MEFIKSLKSLCEMSGKADAIVFIVDVFLFCALLWTLR